MRARVTRVEAVGPYRLVAVERRFDPGTPGRFHLLRAVHGPAYLGRPLSALRVAPEEVEYLLDVRGPGLAALDRPGVEVDVQGPYGRGFDLAAAGPRPVLCGGGIGVAVLPWLREALGRGAVLAGFRDPEHARAASLLPGDARVAVEPVLVTELLRAALPRASSVLACGPDPMLHAVAALCSEHGVPCQLALEAPMACGFGACYGCAVRLDGRLQRLCVEGPVVDGRRLLGEAQPTARSAAKAHPEPRQAAAPPDHPVWLGSVELAHPLVNASGTLDPLAALAAGRAVHEDLAAVVSKTVTPHPREGNAPPRIAEAQAGMINSIGLANPGIAAFRRDVLPRLRALDRPLVVSIGGFSPTDYEELASALGAEPGVVALELNVSCPNVESGCSSIGADAAETREVVRRCRAVTDLPLWVKLSPNVAELGAIAQAAEAAGADALVAINTLRALAVDRLSGMPLLGGPGGGLSGPALLPVALAAVRDLHQASRLPIVGMGGVERAEDAYALLAAGATAVAVGTALFRDAGKAAELRAGIARLICERGLPGPRHWRPDHEARQVKASSGA